VEQQNGGGAKRRPRVISRVRYSRDTGTQTPRHLTKPQNVSVSGDPDHPPWESGIDLWRQQNLRQARDSGEPLCRTESPALQTLISDLG
jgi:hypothetical protein